MNDFYENNVTMLKDYEVSKKERVENQKNDLNTEDENLYFNMDGRVFLEEVELYALKLFVEHRNFLTKQSEFLKQKIDNKNLGIRNLQLQIQKLEQDKIDINNELVSNKNDIENSRIEMKELVNKLSEKYEIGDKWGYDPVTGEIFSNTNEDEDIN